MCMNCCDWVGRCEMHDTNYQVVGGNNQDGTPKGIHWYYVDDKLCEHAAEFLGHDIATFDDQWFSLPNDVTCYICNKIDFGGKLIVQEDDHSDWFCSEHSLKDI